jgi:hypothetical protein
MKFTPSVSLALPIVLLAVPLLASAEIKVTAEHNANDKASAAFKFKSIPSPSRKDAANGKKCVIVEGERDENGGDVEKLTDGKVPQEEDAPTENFFFSAGTAGGRLGLDLEKDVEIKQINTYSWHPNTRGPQVYKLYAAAGSDKSWPKNDPAKAGWKLIANVDTRNQSGGENGGQYAVSISDSDGAIGKYRYLLFDLSRTEVDDDFGNTFYSEIDVVDVAASRAAATDNQAEGDGKREEIEIAGGKYHATLDTTEAPDLTAWAETNVIPMIKEWYPKLVELLPSEGYEAPREFSIIFTDKMRGVAATGGTRIRCAEPWFRSNLQGEALGAVFHEVVHVVQQYGWARRANPDQPRRARAPGWLTEGIPDYIRWYKFEPQRHGAEITQRNFSRAKYDGSYRITANFLNWASEKYEKDLAVKLNAAIRQGKYSEDLWKEYTGHTVQELDQEWRKGLAEKLGLQAGTDNGQSASKKD